MIKLPHLDRLLLCEVEPDSLDHFAGVGALFTRAIDKFTAETFQYFIIYYVHKNNFQYLFLCSPLPPPGACGSNEFLSKKIHTFILLRNSSFSTLVEGKCQATH
jgi:hypothetical protein